MIAVRENGERQIRFGGKVGRGDDESAQHPSMFAGAVVVIIRQRALQLQRRRRKKAGVIDQATKERTERRGYASSHDK